jgi:hypothetical protein
MTVMPRTRSVLAFVSLLVAVPSGGEAVSREVPTGAFVVEHELTLPGSPLVVYEAITGDVSGWWDHSFSEHPYRFYLEAKPGGGFWEIFNESGDGVKHATVTYADRGKLLRFEGPLGLAGNALELVTTYRFSEAGPDSTLLQVSVHGAGEMQEGWPETVDQVWHHFLFERFKPYMERGEYLKK